MWSLLILVVAVLNVECYYSTYTTRERIAHGRRFTVKIPKEAERLEFRSAEPSSPLEMIWNRGSSPRKGRLSGHSSSTSDQRWELSTVGFDDEGTYIVRDYWNKEIKSTLLSVTIRNDYKDRVAGEDLYISLDGINYHETILVFSDETGNYTLVKDGAPVGNDLPDYAGRVKVSNSRITISNVNTSDVGRYSLYDRRNRLVSVTKMNLVDEHPSSAHPLLALLLLLGIPAGVCCCCRKKIFRKKATTTATHVTHVIQADPPPGGPPSYNTPMIPPGSGGQVIYHGGPTTDPNAGYSPGYQPAVAPAPPPQNPVYPPPTMPPAQGFQPGYDPQNPVYPPPAPGGPPQWNGPPPNQYNPAVPPGYNPVAVSVPPATYSEPPKEEMKMTEMTPAAPLLTPPQPQGAPADILSSSSTAAQFQLDTGKGSNFL